MDNRLFLVPNKIPAPKGRLFCFPYAGGDASYFTQWAASLPSSVELIAIQPPGRSTRSDENPHHLMEPLIEELLMFSSYITETPYAFFGHSLGSRVAYELITKLEQLGMRAPAHLIASGSRAPHTNSTEDKISDLPKYEFLNALKRLNGTPDEFFEHPELVDLFTPILRADFRIAENYRSRKKIIPCPITVFGGYDDTDVNYNHLSEWAELSRSKTSIFQIDGDHFFIIKNRNALLRKLNPILEECF